MSLSDLLSEMASERNEKPVRLPLPEAQIMELKALQQRYAAPCPYVSGDLVTPRGNCNVKGAGLPHIVLEVGRPSEAAEPESTASNGYGRRIDMRVACYSERKASIAAFWVESFEFEPYSQN